MDDIFIYLGTLAAIVVGGIALIIILVSRNSRGRVAPSQLRAEPRTVTPRIYFALTESEGELLWLVNGRVIRDLAQITDPAERQAIAKLINHAREVQLPLLEAQRGQSPDEAGLPHVESPLPEADSAITRAPETPAPEPPKPPTAEDDLSRPFLRRLRDSIFGVDYDTKPAPRPLPVRPLLPTGDTKKSLAADSGYGIPRFEELNALVQQKLAEEPDAPPTAIRVGHDGLLEIVVQGRVYGHINEVPDETVRRAMQAAVAIWNRQA